MKRLHFNGLLGAGLLVLALWAGKNVSAQDVCPACIPENQSSVSLDGSYKVCIQSNANHQFSSSEESAIETGVEDYWGDYLDSSGTGIEFDAVSVGQGACPGDTDITIQIREPGQMSSGNSTAGGESFPTSDGHGAQIYLNSMYLGSADWRGTAAHEIGHVLGFLDIHGTGCQGITIMGDDTSWPTDRPTCSDKTGVSGKYVDPDNYEEDYDYDYLYEDCYDLYLTTGYWFFNGSEWIYAGSTSVWVGQYCGPPPI